MGISAEGSFERGIPLRTSPATTLSARGDERLHREGVSAPTASTGANSKHLRYKRICAGIVLGLKKRTKKFSSCLHFGG